MDLLNLWPGAVLLGLLLLLLFHRPLKALLKLALRSGIGLALLAGWSATGILPALALGVNWFNALVLGLLGGPGLGLLLLLRWITLP